MSVAYNPLDPQLRIDPYPHYKRLREADPVQFVPASGMWFLSRYADCFDVLRDPRFSSRQAHRLRQRAVALAPTMLNSDPPEHTRLRSAASVAWNPSSLNEARPHIQAIVDELLRGFEGRPEIDIVSEYANPLAARSLAVVLGVPAADCARLHRWMIECSGNVDPMASPRAQDRGAAASARMRQYFASLTDERRRSPRGDFLSSLALSSMTIDEVLETCNLLVIGGYEPLANLIGNGMLALLHHPAERERLRAEPTLAKSAVEELLRFDSPIPFVARSAREDVVIDGHLVRSGQSVIPLLGAANRDPAVFEAPDRLDLSRAPNPHLSFGAGMHACFGALFTRLVGQIAIPALVERFPDLTLSTRSIEWRPSVVPRGLKALHVRPEAFVHDG